MNTYSSLKMIASPSTSLKRAREEDESENETDSNLQDLLDQSPRQRCKWDYWEIMLVVFKNKMKLFLGSLELKEICFFHIISYIPSNKKCILMILSPI